MTFGNALLVGQVALSLLSLVTASLFLRSIQHAYSIDPGFETARLAIVMINPGQAGYDKPRTEQFYRDARARVSALPGIESVSWASNLPFWNRAPRGIVLESRQQPPKTATITPIVNPVALNYFSTPPLPPPPRRDSPDHHRHLPVP